MFYIAKKQILTVRDIDEQTWRKFRSRTAEEGLKAGVALTQAMRMWVMDRELSHFKPDPKLLLEVRAVSVGKKKVRWSEEIDETLSLRSRETLKSKKRDLSFL